MDNNKGDLKSQSENLVAVSALEIDPDFGVLVRGMRMSTA